MKKISILTIVVAIFALVSCIKHKESAYLSVSTGQFVLPTPHDTILYTTLYYTNDWQAKFDGESWCRVLPSSGKGSGGNKIDSVTLVISVEANKTEAVRENVLQIKSENIMISPQIIQAK